MPSRPHGIRCSCTLYDEEAFISIKDYIHRLVLVSRHIQRHWYRDSTL